MPGKLFIVLGDTTSHGGTVASAQSPMTFQGKPVATVGDMTYCPKCKGSFAIVQGGGNIELMGRHLARAGDKTACGAVLIPGKQTLATHEPVGGSAATTAVAGLSMGKAATAMNSLLQEAGSSFDHQMLLTDELTGVPLARQPYRVATDVGKFEGVTDEEGLTQRIYTGSAAKPITVEILGIDELMM
ncbi:bacteriophage gp29 protein [Chitiniphilus shinanonensis]|uniref:Bacteriophage gp29 protein n=1 Tax=Chitiniphilus shinanonensis TaxID=553088 RepID=A0ABQ6BTG7_9NEIS|nr:PAAR domain-containing protein [Chitiniphilus shinanonensis]GLS04889.1 bacteriophage gp29 protein [Chitiniphilus shinanonensis]